MLLRRSTAAERTWPTRTLIPSSWRSSRISVALLAASSAQPGLLGPFVILQKRGQSPHGPREVEHGFGSCGVWCLPF